MGTASRRVAFLIAMALLPTIAGCTPEASPAPEVVPAATTNFGGTDLAWIEISIAMNDQVLPLLALVSTRGDDAALTKLSADVEATATAELSTLHSLHDQAGLPAENPHEGMPMPGLVPPEEVTRVAGLSGPSFDRAVIEQLEGYLEQSHRLAEQELTSGTDPQTRDLATRTATARATALRQLTA
ncbi:DUF305 domain-containing protein [Asanoa sp. NPDC049573]|uniref:DUF305 domain-containing protein n=1 Tax=Asanoa sp. NPDC049573 TaxID=3155396 RepID=UPI0034430153